MNTPKETLRPSIYIILLLIGLLAIPLSLAQAQNSTPSQTTPDKPATETKASSAASTPDSVSIDQQKKDYPLDICVVGGGKLGEHGDPVDYVYKGRLVRFCCSGCISAFEKEPAKYLAKIDNAKAKPKNESTTTPPAPSSTIAEKAGQTKVEVWTCTMHPEVRESKPGKCPKCGMALVLSKDATGTKPTK